MRVQKEIENVTRVPNRYPTEPLTMEDAVIFHKKVVERAEKARKELNKELGIGDIEEKGFTGRTDKKFSTTELKKMKLSESLFLEDATTEGEQEYLDWNQHRNKYEKEEPKKTQNRQRKNNSNIERQRKPKNENDINFFVQNELSRHGNPDYWKLKVNNRYNDKNLYVDDKDIIYVVVSKKPNLNLAKEVAKLYGVINKEEKDGNRYILMLDIPSTIKSRKKAQEQDDEAEDKLLGSIASLAKLPGKLIQAGKTGLSKSGINIK